MSGKMPIFAVLGLGLMASMCAAVLMAALRTDGEAVVVPTTVEILVAKSNLPAMSMVVEELLEVREVAIRDMPEGAITDPVQILGRVLKSGLVAGQPLLTSAVLREEGGAQLASSLPPGMRAVSVEINGSSAMRGLLFPGCSVDVIVSYKSTSARTRSASPVSQTLLQNVRVLAVEDKTVFTSEDEPDEEEKSSSFSRRPVGRGLMVTLMVDPQQARELQSARDIGELSLSLRNPLDGSLTADPTAAVPELSVAMEAPPESAEPAGPWRVVVVRGGDKTEIVKFDGEGALPDERGGAGDDRYADVPIELENEVE